MSDFSGYAIVLVIGILIERGSIPCTGTANNEGRER